MGACAVAHSNPTHEVRYDEKLLLVLTVAFTLLTGCASVPLVQPRMPDASNRAEVVIFRESAFNAGGVGVSFGADEQAFVTLGNSEYASIFIPPGTYKFFVRARSADPTTLSQTLKAGDRRCLRTVADPSNLAKVVIPIVMMASGYGFLLEELPCPSGDQLAKYSRVDVEYQKP